MLRSSLAAGFAAIALSACGSAATSAAPAAPTASTAPAPAASPASSAAATMKLVDYALDPATLSVHAGDSLLVQNAGKTPHNLWIRDSAGKVVAKTPNLDPGQSATLKLDLAPGSYVTYCQEPGHESLGMRGTLTVG